MAAGTTAPEPAARRLEPSASASRRSAGSVRASSSLGPTASAPPCTLTGAAAADGGDPEGVSASTSFSSSRCRWVGVGERSEARMRAWAKEKSRSSASACSKMADAMSEVAKHMWAVIASLSASNLAASTTATDWLY